MLFFIKTASEFFSDPNLGSPEFADPDPSSLKGTYGGTPVTRRVKFMAFPWFQDLQATSLSGKVLIGAFIFNALNW